MGFAITSMAFNRFRHVVRFSSTIGGIESDPDPDLTPHYGFECDCVEALSCRLVDQAAEDMR